MGHYAWIVIYLNLVYIISLILVNSCVSQCLTVYIWTCLRFNCVRMDKKHLVYRHELKYLPVI